MDAGSGSGRRVSEQLSESTTFRAPCIWQTRALARHGDYSLNWIAQSVGPQLGTLLEGVLPILEHCWQPGERAGVLRYNTAP